MKFYSTSLFLGLLALADHALCQTVVKTTMLFYCSTAITIKPSASTAYTTLTFTNTITTVRFLVQGESGVLAIFLSRQGEA